MTTNDEQTTDGLIGRTISERYRIDRRIARGGMGVVYVAEHLRLQRPIVFKVLSEHLVDDAKAKARFEQEALGLSRLNHPNIVTVYDFGTEEGITYIAMEYVPGLTLSDVLRRDGVMTFDRLLPLAVQIIQAIGAAHEKEIVHRDIKPANIMVVSEPGHADVVKVLDFGLARLTSSSVDITKDNLVGTVSYVAPEVVKGARAGKAADVYALAVMFYFMLTGRKPFKAEDDLSVLYKHVHDTPVHLSELLHEGHDVPAAFIDLIHKCMAKEPGDRPPDGNALLGELSDIISLPSMPRLPSGEYQAAAQPAPKADPVAPEDPGSFPSIELSSIALRERPNSRWGIPLVALCVFVAGAIAIFAAASSRSEAEQPAPANVEGSPTEETKVGESTAVADDVEDHPTQKHQGSHESAADPNDVPSTTADARPGDRDAEKVQPTSEPGLDKPEPAAAVTERKTPPTTTKPVETGDDEPADEEESMDVPVLPVPSDDSPLLDADEGSDGILLRVE